MGHFERDPHIFQDIMFGLIAAALAINGHRGGAFLKWPPERIHPRYREGNGLDDSFGAPFLWFLLGIEVRFCHKDSH
jgi:hypothetical protein